MAIPATLDLVLSRLSMPELHIGHTIMDWYRRATGQSPRNDGNTNQSDGIFKAPQGKELGYLVRMSWFPTNAFPDYIVELIDFSDRRNKSIHYASDPKDSRKMGGPYDLHPLGILNAHFEVAAEIAPQLEHYASLSLEQALTVMLNESLVIAGKRHDDWEDHKKIKTSIDTFKALSKEVEQIPEEKRKGAKEYKEMEGARAEVKRLRKEIIEEEYILQKEFIQDIASRFSLNGATTKRVILSGDVAMGYMDWVTRHVEEKFFTVSLDSARRWYLVINYLKEGRGGPLQAKVMESLGVKRGHEPGYYFLGRLYLKGLDRLLNSRERKPNYTDKQSSAMEAAFQRNPWLVDMYGNVVFLPRYEQGLPNEELHELLYRNSVYLSSVDKAITAHGDTIFGQRAESPLAFGYLLGTLKLRELIIKESRAIITELKEKYVGMLGHRRADQIKAEVDSMHPLEFQQVTGDGPITNGYWYETGRRVNQERDRPLQVETNFQDALGYGKLMDNFEMGPPGIENIINLGSGVFKLFTVDGLNGGISFNMKGRPGEVSYTRGK